MDCMFAFMIIAQENVLQQHFTLEKVNLSSLLNDNEVLLASSREEFVQSMGDVSTRQDASIPIPQQFGIGLTSPKMIEPGNLYIL